MAQDAAAVEPETAEPKKRPSGFKTLGIAAIAVGWLAVPVIVLMFTPLAAGAGVAASGMIGVAMAALLGGPRWGLLVTVWSVVAIGLAPVGLLYPALGVLFIACMGASTGFASLRGMQMPFILINLVTAMTMLNPPALTQAEVTGGIHITPSYILTLMLVVAIGAIWSCLSMLFLRTKIKVPALVPLQREKAIVYGASLAFLTGLSAAVSLTWFQYTLTGWIILTIYMIFRSEFLSNDALPAMRKKIVHRSAGTVGGVIIAGVIALGITNENALILCGLVFATLAASRTLASAPYWQFVILLTPAMVFLDSGGVHVDATALTRLACTFIGIVLAVAAMEFNRVFTFPWIKESREREDLAEQAAAG